MNREEGTARSKKVWEETGKRLAATRKERGKTQEDIGAMFGLEQKQWSKYENGRPIPIYLCLDIAEKLHISLDWLLTGKGTMKNGTQEKAPEEMTVRDVCTALVSMTTVTIMDIKKNSAPDQKINECSISMTPRKKVYFAGGNSNTAVDLMGDESGALLPCDRHHIVVDNRGAVICDFLLKMKDALGKDDDHISSAADTFHKVMELHLNSLPALSLAPLPIKIKEKEIPAPIDLKKEHNILFYEI